MITDNAYNLCRLTIGIKLIRTKAMATKIYKNQAIKYKMWKSKMQPWFSITNWYRKDNQDQSNRYLLKI